MSETTTRKAVVTTEAVRTALAGYLAVRKELGFEDSALEFDKGPRGKGFAVYNGAVTVTSFETKEEAFNHYARYAEVAAEVLGQVIKNQEAKKEAEQKPATKTTVKATEKPAA